MRLLAQIGMELEIFDDAEFLLESVLVLAPDYHLARYEYASVLAKLHRYAKALGEVRTLLERDPQERNYRTLLATIQVGWATTSRHWRCIANWPPRRRRARTCTSPSPMP